MWFERTDLVKNAIKEAYDRQEETERNTTVVTEHEDGNKTVTTFYKKGKAIWCKMVTGCIETNSRVYKTNTENPYIRDFGRFWYLDEESKKCVKYLTA